MIGSELNADGGVTSNAAGSTPFCPDTARVLAIEPEVREVATFRLEVQDPARQSAYRNAPGQFNMLYVPGIGEVAISVSSAPGEHRGIAHTIRFVGQVTRVIEQLRPGDLLGLRGPYGVGWPMEQAAGRDVLVVAGGLGLAPLRPAVVSLLARGAEAIAGGEPGGRLVVLYGARTPADLLYRREYEAWRRRGAEMWVTVDRADAAWSGRVGVVPALLGKVAVDPERAVAFVCGPEVMMRFAVYELLARGVPPQRIFLSLERNMQCAEGLCGRCQLGPFFLCKDGPVLSYDRVGRFFRQEHF